VSSSRTHARTFAPVSFFTTVRIVSFDRLPVFLSVLSARAVPFHSLRLFQFGAARGPIFILLRYVAMCYSVTQCLVTDFSFFCLR
jgi:hypothetical protein